MGIKDKATDVAGDLKDKAQGVAQKLDDKAEEMSQKDGVVGKAAGSTALTVYGPGKQLIAAVNVTVSADLDGFKNRLHEILPEEVLRCELLCTFIRGMIAADPVRRFPSAEAADLFKEGAAAFHRQLVIGNLASEYDNDIRLWPEELKELDAQDDIPSEAA